MRQIVVMMSVSLDGFISGPDGELDWHLVDDELHQHFNDELATAGAFLDGRVTYQLMAEYWPTADADPTAPATVAQFARIWREMPKLVFSRTLRQADWNATVLPEVVPDEIRRLKAEPGGDLIVGGADLGACFQRHGLVDEYRIYLHPIVLGRGRLLFRNPDLTVDLQLVDTRTFGNGVVMLRYRTVAG